MLDIGLLALHVPIKSDLYNNPMSRFHSGEETDSERLSSDFVRGLGIAGLNRVIYAWRLVEKVSLEQRSGVACRS